MASLPSGFFLFHVFVPVECLHDHRLIDVNPDAANVLAYGPVAGGLRVEQ
jgi:hypothetical protein